MARVLVTGASGFVGSHLSRALVARGHEVFGTFHPSHQGLTIEGVRWLPWDVKDSLAFVLENTRPEHVYHLASPAHVPTTGADPVGTVEQILVASMRFLTAIRAQKTVQRVLYTSSAEVYAPPLGTTPLSEASKVSPRSIYGICKEAATQWLLLEAPELVTVVRPFNQIGPGQSPLFAVASFAQQIANIVRGTSEPVLRVGNVDVARDFSDVRDSVQGHILALEKGRPGEIYNIAAGRALSLRAIIEALIEQSKVGIEIQVDPARVRANDVPVVVGDAGKLKQETGYAPKSTGEAAARAALDSALS